MKQILKQVFTAHKCQCSAGWSMSIALAPAPAIILAPTLCYLRTACCRWWGCASRDCPAFIFSDPVSVPRTSMMRNQHYCPRPDDASLIGFAFWIFLENCSRRGIESWGCCFLANKSERASSTPFAEIDLSYINMTKSSRWL